MDLRELVESLTVALDDLADANRTAPILVEGENDVKALRTLGVQGDIIPLNRGTTVLSTCEAVAARAREAIVLTDWDARGGRLGRLLREGLAANGVRANTDLRARITVLCRKDIKDVESLPRYLERLSREAAGGRGKASKRWYGGRH